MASFSRNTFDPAKDYVAVRLQQGVPLLDADWNELNDVTRQELYDGFALTFTDGVQPGGFDFEVLQSDPGTNDFQVLAGAALVRGRPVRVRRNLRYSTQPWVDPQRAARDGVAVIPRLTTPPGPPEGAPPRIDIVYLDVWEREVGSDEDANLINPSIGVETCVRLKREAAVRVAEGATALPSAPADHVFLPLALLRRPTSQATITAQQIADRRLFFHGPQGSHVASFFPAFRPVSAVANLTTTAPEWRINPFNPVGAEVPKFHAFKTQNEAAMGVLPLALPHGARLTSFRITGVIDGQDGRLQWQLIRIDQRSISAPTPSANEFFDILSEDTIRALSTRHIFGSEVGFGIADLKLIVDNNRYSYVLFARTFPPPPAYSVSIHGLSIRYEYFGLVRPSHEHDEGR